MAPAAGRVALARQYTPAPMGQGGTDNALAAALAALGAAPGGAPLQITDLQITGMRDRTPGLRRAPVARLARAPRPLQLAAGRVLYRGCDLVHRLDLRLPPAPAPEILTVHDLAPVRFTDEGELPSSARAAVRAAAAVITPSHFSAAELSAWSGRGDIEVIPNGVNPAFLTATPPSAEQRTAAELPERWVLHAGGVTERKNLARLAAAWPAVHARHPDVGLLLCGPDDRRRSALFDPLPGARVMGRVAPSLLLALMAGAAAVVVPSIYEGYGLPVSEALAAGVPAVAVSAASIPEVAGPGTILVPDATEALADGLERALAGVDPAELAAGRAEARGRTWEANARRHMAVYERVLRARGREM